MKPLCKHPVNWIYLLIFFSDAKVQSIKKSLEQHQLDRVHNLKRFQNEYDKFMQHVSSIIEQFECSNDQISQILTQFTSEADEAKGKRKEKYDVISQETQSDMEQLKKKIISFAAVNKFCAYFAFN